MPAPVISACPWFSNTHRPHNSSGGSFRGCLRIWPRQLLTTHPAADLPLEAAHRPSRPALLTAPVRRVPAARAPLARYPSMYPFVPPLLPRPQASASHRTDPGPRQLFSCVSVYILPPPPPLQPIFHSHYSIFNPPSPTCAALSCRGSSVPRGDGCSPAASTLSDLICRTRGGGGMRASGRSGTALGTFPFLVRTRPSSPNPQSDRCLSPPS
jgi:hypothetical protein